MTIVALPSSDPSFFLWVGGGVGVGDGGFYCCERCLYVCTDLATSLLKSSKVSSQKREQIYCKERPNNKIISYYHLVTNSLYKLSAVQWLQVTTKHLPESRVGLLPMQQPYLDQKILSTTIALPAKYINNNKEIHL